MVLVSDGSALRHAVASQRLPRLPERAERILIPTVLVDALGADGTLDALLEAGLEALFEVVSLTASDLARVVNYPDAEPLALMARPDLSPDALLTEDPALRAAAHIEGFTALSLDELFGGASEAPAALAPPGTLPAALALDSETERLVEALVERGVGRDAADVLRRAVRGLAAATL